MYNVTTNRDRLKRKLIEACSIQQGLTLKCLRHAVAILGEMGKVHAYQDALDQKTEAMAKHYSRRAEMAKRMAEIAKDFNAAVTPDSRPRRRGLSEFASPQRRASQRDAVLRCDNLNRYIGAGEGPAPRDARRPASIGPSPADS
jgi:hypothetical protein